jgi:methylglyoxal synthase
MIIALITHDAKKGLLSHFCVAYSNILSRHKLCASLSTGELIEKATNIHVTKFMDDYYGGCEQISSRISCGEIDMVIFFRDPIHPQFITSTDNDILRVCDVHLIPYATNIATAEILIHGLERGDFEWRNIGRPVI